MAYTFMVRQAVIAASANAAINGWKAWIAFRGQSGLVLTVDSISAGSGTVLGTAVAGAFGLALAGTAVTFFTFRSAARKQRIELEANVSFWPKYLLLMLKNALFLFGLLVVLSILFHKAFGEVAVNPAGASAVTTALGFCISLYTGLTTMNAMVAKSPVARQLHHAAGHK